MNNFVTSQIRTAVPIIVGQLIGLAAKHFGVIIDADSEVQLVAAFTSIAGILYYTIVRYLERRFPNFGWLLGSKSQPVYKDPEHTPKIVLK